MSEFSENVIDVTGMNNVNKLSMLADELLKLKDMHVTGKAKYIYAIRDQLLKCLCLTTNLITEAKKDNHDLLIINAECTLNEDQRHAMTEGINKRLPDGLKCLVLNKGVDYTVYKGKTPKVGGGSKI